MTAIIGLYNLNFKKILMSYKMKREMFLGYLFVITIFTCLSAFGKQKPSTTHNTQPIQNLEKQIVLIDFDTNQILLEQNANKPMHPSSMTKIMTAYLIMEKIKQGIINEQTFFIVGSNAYGLEGTSLSLKLGQSVTVLDLLKGLMIVSGNDAATVLAEGMAGSETAFAKMMTEKAKALGANHTNFINASGLPNPQHLTTAIDMSIIAKRTITDFPNYFYLYSQMQFSFNDITKLNKNPLLYKNGKINNGIIYDGIKTGYSTIAGYGMVASATYKGRRLLLVINGLPSKRARADETFNLLNWGMNAFSNYYLFKPQQLVINTPVWYGQEEEVPLTVEKGVLFTIERDKIEGITSKLIYKTPLSAPIEKGQVVGHVQVSHKDWAKPLEFPLITAVSVARAGFFKRISETLRYLFLGGQSKKK